MRKLTPLLLAAAVGVGSTLSLVAPAQAATVVSVKKIANPAPGEIGTTVTIKPSVSVSKNVRVSSSLLNVSLDGKAVVRNQKSATLKRTALSVTYNVSTVVKYRVRDSKGKLGPTRQKSLRQTLTVKPVYTTKCATPGRLRVGRPRRHPQHGRHHRHRREEARRAPGPLRRHAQAAARRRGAGERPGDDRLRRQPLRARLRPGDGVLGLRLPGLRGEPGLRRVLPDHEGTARAFDKADLSNTEQPPSDNPERSRFSVQSFR
ncbi:MAG: hypothetical protein PGN15_09145 [Aeromicrobium erythreum]